MKVSYKNLQEYFDGKLPSPEVLEHELTFHAWEVEGKEQIGDDTVLDIKVLPDKSAWVLSHRGVAKDISTILTIPLAHDPLAHVCTLSPSTNELRIEVQSSTCDRYTAALIRGVTVGPSPEWLQDFLRSLGQRSINNIVDLTNYVMFSIGQPLHAFDAHKLSHENGYHIVVRDAQEAESITTLTGETYTLSKGEALIVDGGTNTPIGIAGIKGGKRAAVEESTIDILLESAHFDSVAIRRSSGRLKLRTDASQRYENNISRSMAGYGVVLGAEFIKKFCGGDIVGYVDTNPEPVVRTPVSLPLTKINNVLGLSLTLDEVQTIFSRFGYTYRIDSESITVTPPHERPDLVIPEDIIEEIGRIYGYEHVASVVPHTVPLTELNVRHYYSELIRDTLVAEGFSEVITSSFRKKDEIELQNALASDKGCLRSSLRGNIVEVLDRNMPNADLLKLRTLQVFEIGTVFGKVKEGKGIVEHMELAVGVRVKQGGYTPKDDARLSEVKAILESALGIELGATIEKGVLTIDLTNFIATLPVPSTYTPFRGAPDVTYTPFSVYPFVSRDIALWAEESTTANDVDSRIKETAGSLLLHTTLFDEFHKEGKVSYAFRLVFQSFDRTLTDEEVGEVMDRVIEVLTSQGFTVR